MLTLKRTSSWGFTCTKMACKIKFGHLVYNQQNYIIFYWYFNADWKICSLHIIIFFWVKVDFFEPKFPPKWLLTCRMIEVFINVWLNLVVPTELFMITIQRLAWTEEQSITELFMSTIQKLAWTQGKSIPSEYFVLNSQSGFSHISTAGSLSDGTMELGSKNMVS